MCSEAQLIVLAKAGDEQAFEALAKTAYKFIVQKLLSRYYRRISQEDAEDAFQDAMVVFINNPLSVKAKTDKEFYKWVEVTSRRKIQDLLKSADYRRKTPLIIQGKDGEKDMEMEFAAPGNVEENIINREVMGLIRSDLDKLLQIDKVIICDYYSGYSLQEIAVKVGLSYDNVRQRKRRAISRLRTGKLKEFK